MTALREKCRILVVDDAPSNIKIMGEALRVEHQVIFATNGKDAIKLASTDPPPDLILLDIVMPEMDGYEVCQRLKERSETEHIPIIFITAMSEVEEETRGLELGAVDYITKPFSMAIVKARVRTHLELKRHRDILQNLSCHDGLTGIPNRRRFDDTLEKEWRRAHRQHTTLSLIMLDIDFFKAFNDTYGHLSGDDCIRQVAGALAGVTLRASDLAARYGGEEFAAILPGTDAPAAFALAERVRERVAALCIPHAHSNVADHVTVSLGVASTSPEADVLPTTLVETADRGLYEAKNAGRNQVGVFLE